MFISSTSWRSAASGRRSPPLHRGWSSRSERGTRLRASRCRSAASIRRRFPARRCLPWSMIGDAMGHAVGLIHIVRGEEDGDASRSRSGSSRASKAGCGFADRGPSVGSSRKRIFGVCRKPRAISSRRFMPPENVFDLGVAALPQLEQPQQPLDAFAPELSRHVIEDAVDVHVLVGGQVAIEAGVLEDDAEPLARFRDGARGRGRPATLPLVGLSSVVSILMVVVLPAPLGPRKAKISPGATSKETSSTATKSPNRLFNP